MPTVLVVEDHEDTLEVMAKIIDRFGYRALRALTAEAGLAMLATEKPDIIIVDGMMPGMNGTEFIRLCRADLNTAHIPVILYTALMDAKFSEDAVRKGANEVWHKGRIDVDQMQERLEHYLRRGTGDGGSLNQPGAAQKKCRRVQKEGGNFLRGGPPTAKYYKSSLLRTQINL